MKNFNIQLLIFVLCVCHGSAQEIEREVRLPSEIEKPEGLCVTMFNDWFVSDLQSQMVYLLDAQGQIKTHYGGKGWEMTQLDHPGDIASADGINIYVADYHNQRIQHFNRRLELVSSLGRAPADYLNYVSNSRIGRPKSIAISQRGELFYIDDDFKKIAKVNSLGNVESSFNAKTVLQSPNTIRLKGNFVYIAETQRILKYDYFGNLVLEIKNSFLKDIRDVAIDDQGRLYVMDGKKLALVILDSSGGLLKVSSEYEFINPRRIVIVNDRLYILDAEKGTIVILKMPI